MNMIAEVCEININIDQRDVEVWVNDLLPEKTGLLDLILIALRSRRETLMQTIAS